MTDLKAAVFTVLEGWALPLDARKILETAYYAQPEIKMTPEHLPQYIATNNIKPTTEGGGGAGGGMTDREAMKIAFDAFEDLKAFATDSGAMPENWDAYYPKQYDALEVLRRVLALPEQIITPISPDQYERLCFTCGACVGKPWVGLTHEEAQEIAKRLVDDVAYCSTHYAIAIEVALRKKNGN